MKTYDRRDAVRIMNQELQNPGAAFDAAEIVEIPLVVACALLEKESHGANIWGNDSGGVFSGFPDAVTGNAYHGFLWEVTENGRTSNGVGPTQITFAGHFAKMAEQGLLPWIPLDNMEYGFGLLKANFIDLGTWEKAGTAYNGSAAYGADLVVKMRAWREKLADAEI